jgi:O-antigen ligase
MPWAAAVVLLSPFQLLIWLVLAGNEQALLTAFVFMLSLAGADMLPRPYEWFVLYPSAVILFVLPTLTRSMFAESTPTVRLQASESVPLIAFGVWTVASGVNSVLRGWGCNYLVFMTVFTVEVMLIAYSAAIIPRSLQQVRILVYVIVGSTALVAACLPLLPSVSATMGKFGGKIVQAPAGRTSLNIVACSLATAAAIGLGMATLAHRVVTRVLLAVVVLVCVAMLVFTKSRGAWLGFAVAALYILLMTRSFGLLLFGSGSALVMTGFDFLRSVLQRRAVATTASDPSLLARFLLWLYALRIGKDNWLFGVGMENFRYVKHFYRYPEALRITREYNAHNIYLEILADLGVVGLAIFMWILTSTVLRSLRAMRFEGARDVGLGISAGIIAMSVHGLVDAVVLHPGEFALLGILVGLSISIRRLTTADASARRPLSHEP